MTDPHYETVIHIGVAHKDERGEIRNVLQGVELRHVGVITRAKGCVFGNHVHPKPQPKLREIVPGGTAIVDSPTINVQRMYLISGSYRSVSAPVDNEGVFIGPPREFIVKAGDLTEVGHDIGHAYEALEDCLFLNLNTTTREVDGYGEHTKPLPVRLIP